MLIKIINDTKIGIYNEYVLVYYFSFNMLVNTL